MQKAQTVRVHTTTKIRHCSTVPGKRPNSLFRNILPINHLFGRFCEASEANRIGKSNLLNILRYPTRKNCELDSGKNNGPSLYYAIFCLQNLCFEYFASFRAGAGAITPFLSIFYASMQEKRFAGVNVAATAEAAWHSQVTPVTPSCDSTHRPLGSIPCIQDHMPYRA